LVFVQLTDPVGSGFVSSLPAPGGNITGFTSYEPAMASKWLELLKEISPRLTNVAILFNPQTAPYSPAMLSTIAAAARVIALQPIPKPIDDAGAIEKAIEAAARESDAGLLVLPDVTTTVHQALIIRLAAKHRLPAIYPWRHFVGAGGLMAYSVDLPDLWRRAASYVDRVLKGQRPADLPVQAPIKFGLVINLKAAKAQGLDVPLLMLARADEVIE
jgi:putative ABC transport system substrate-binding protein